MQEYWRVFVGPRYQPAASSFFFDWSAYDADAADTLAAETTVATKLLSAQTVLTVASTADFASVGGIWIGPNATGEAWEYVSYTAKTATQFTGIARESSAYREHNGEHSVGALVRQWWELDSNDGRLRIIEDSDEELCSVRWYADIAGVVFPQAALRNNHIVIVQTRATLSASWVNRIVGFVDSLRSQDDYTRTARWNVRIVASDAFVSASEARGVRVGELDIAPQGSATSSPPLAAAHKEDHNGDYTSLRDTFGADKAIDGDPNTMWISEMMVGTENTPGAYSGISQMYINPHTALRVRGYRWLELVNVDFADESLVVYNPDDLTQTQLDLPSDSAGPGEYILVVENQALFEQENPYNEATLIFDLSSFDDAGDRAWFDHFRPEGGVVSLINSLSSHNSVMVWGDQTSEPGGWAGPGWSGNAIPAPGVDETMRRDHTSAAVDEGDKWIVGMDQSPGYLIRLGPDDAWLQVQAPEMNWTLTSAINDSVATIPISLAGTPSTDGLDAAHTIVIGDEEISYAGKTGTALTGAGRGANDTDPASHSEGESVLILASAMLSNVSSSAWPIKRTEFIRDTGNILIATVNLFWTARAFAPTPDTSQHEDAYPYQEEDYFSGSPVVHGGLRDSLVAYWALNESAGSRLDSHGAFTLLDNNGVGSATGHVYALAADFVEASSQYLSIADNATLSAGDFDFWCAAWVKLDNKTSGHVIVGQYDTGANQRSWQLSYNLSADRFRLHYSVDGTAELTLDATGFGSPDTNWHLVQFWYDAALEFIFLKVDAAQVDAAQHSGGLHDSTASFLVGAGQSSGAPTGFLDGLIGPIAVGKGHVPTGSDLAWLWNGGAGQTYTLFTFYTGALRVRNFLMQFESMQTDPARARVNRLRLIVDEQYFDSDYWLSDGETVEEVIERIFLNSGLPQSALTVTVGGQVLDGFATAADRAWPVVCDLADYGGSVITVERDSKITIAPDTLWDTNVGGYTSVQTWDRDSAKRVEMVQTRSDTVSQVRLTWQSEDGLEGGTVDYPATPDSLGRVLEIGPYIYPDIDAATLSARKRYWMRKFPTTFLVEGSEGNWSWRPRQIHTLIWQFATDMQPISRTCLVGSVEHVIENNLLLPIVHLIQIDREAI